MKKRKANDYSKVKQRSIKEKSEEQKILPDITHLPCRFFLRYVLQLLRTLHNLLFNFFDLGIERLEIQIEAQFFIEDLRSKNGTYLKGKLITKPMQFLPESAVVIGKSILRFDGFNTKA